jgi:hypothetical protein
MGIAREQMWWQALALLSLWKRLNSWGIFLASTQGYLRPWRSQLGYQETSFLLECIKAQKNNSSGPHFVLFSSFAQDFAYRLASVPACIIVSRSHDVSLYFTFEECKGLCKSLTRDRGFSIPEDILRHLFTLTNGHPGLFHGLFKALLDRKASACSSKYCCFKSLFSLFLLFVTTILPMQVNYSMLICVVPHRIFVPRLLRQDWCL